MAESFAFAIADRVLGKLGSALIQEVGLAWGVKTELEELNDTLSTIRAVLLDAEEKQATSHQLRDWLGKLKDGFYDAEDIVDEFEYEALRQKVVASGSFKTKADWVRNGELTWKWRTNQIWFFCYDWMMRLEVGSWKRVDGAGNGELIKASVWVLACLPVFFLILDLLPQC
ncbi:hypothetical protein VitviT2T_025823 [Vitis vinifera]|uniref:Disease resistance N-terminal domain-containing protein n=1 Tax=Vitis vinifera TaxID=29760 RepID=A0ABY9DLZ2_VITVI|nr:hypothetical protein VitviT2T_025823 [Vitis vinifera]